MHRSRACWDDVPPSGGSISCAVVWESAVLAAPTSLAALDLKKGGNSHQYCAILDSFEWHNCTLMIDDNTHTHKVTMMTRCSTTCKVLFFVVIFGRKWIEKSIWQLVFFCFWGALASLPGNLINFSLFHVFFQLRKFYCALFLKNVTLLWNFPTLHTVCIPTPCTFCMANSNSKTRNFRPLFSWVAITWLLDSRGALTPTQDYPTGTIAVG